LSVCHSDVAIVSLCEYDPLTNPLTALSASNKERYARKHGYQLYFETKRIDDTRPPAWSKVPALLLSFH
jgi:galactosyl transferase GMA12/MNN10 family